MCWFSAHEMLPTRDAIEGEELVVQDFSESGRRWLASPQEPEVAVCLTSGCNLRLTGIPDEMREALHVGSEAVAEFRENYQPPRTFLQRLAPPEHLHDVLVFSGRLHYPVRRLPVGMRIDVLSSVIAMPVKQRTEARISESVPV